MRFTELIVSSEALRPANLTEETIKLLLDKEGEYVLVKVFPKEDLNACIVTDTPPILPNPKVRYSCGIDVGKGRDFGAVVVMDKCPLPAKCPSPANGSLLWLRG